MPLMQRHYPEVMAGGYTRTDGTVEFFQRVQALLAPEHVVLEFGAGRGVGLLEDSVGARRLLRELGGENRRIVGVDVDPVVLDNPFLDEAHVITPDGALPFANASIDMIISDYVFEHVSNPMHVASELDRVLKSGGWLCARTPNRNSPLGTVIRLIPNRHHVSILSRVQEDRKVVDVFPTCYQLNRVSDLKRHFPESTYLHASYTWDGEPNYVGNSTILWHAMRLMFRLQPRRYRSNLFIFLQKR